jgi:hypothetical protein
MNTRMVGCYGSKSSFAPDLCEGRHLTDVS